MVYRDDFEMPVLFFTQLIGLALSFSAKQMHLNKHFTDPLPMLRDKGLIKEGIGMTGGTHG
jgi:heterodisulfide reductase subunit B